MNRLSTEERVRVVAALVEGNSIRSTVRMTGISKPTVLKLLADLGSACERFHDTTVRKVKASRVQCDEIWAFCYAKEKNVPKGKQGRGYGDVWTWTGIDADSKLIVSWRVGRRDPKTAFHFMWDLSDRLANKVQLTTDGHGVYLDAVETWFHGNIDYARLVKMYGAAPEKEIRYSPAVCTGCKVEVVSGNPDPAHISTSFAERQNLSMRMGMRRFTRLTNAFSKKLANHAHAVALYFTHYNFARVHQTLRVTPAMAAGLADHVWSLEEIVGLVEASERQESGQAS